MREVGDGRWRVHSTTIIICLFLMYGLGFVGFTGYSNGVVPHSVQLASVYSGGYIIWTQLGVWLQVLASGG